MNEEKTITEQVETILETMVEYYDSDDFKDNYAHVLIEDTQNNGADRLVENSKRWWDSEELTEEQAEKIIEYITDNYSEYVRDYRNYYVGDDSVGSCEFGEQEEEFPEGVDKSLFDEDEYNGDFCYVSGRFYYDMSSNGIHFKVTEDDAKIILATLDEEEKENAKYENFSE